MERNVFTEFTEQIQGINEKAGIQLKKLFQPKPKPVDVYWKEIEEEAKGMTAFITDPVYADYQKVLNALKKELENKLEFALTGFGEYYSREQRADRAAVVQGQITLLKYLLECPEKAINLVRERDLK